MDIFWKSIFLDQNRLFGLDVNFYVRNRFLGSESSESNFWLIIKISSSESNLASKFIFGSNIGIWLRIGFWAQILSFWVFDSESIFGIRIGFLGFESIFWALIGHRVEFWVVNWFWGWSWLFWPQNRFMAQDLFLATNRLFGSRSFTIDVAAKPWVWPPLPPVLLMFVFHILDYLPLLSLFDKKNKW